MEATVFETGCQISRGLIGAIIAFKENIAAGVIERRALGRSSDCQRRWAEA